MSFSPKILEHWLCPHGLELKCRAINPPGSDEFDTPAEYVHNEEQWYEMSYSGFLSGGKQFARCRFLMSLPIFGADNTFTLRDGRRVVVHRCYPDYQAEAGERRYLFRKPAFLVLDRLQKALSQALQDFFFTGTPPHGDAVQAKIKRIFSDATYFPLVAGSKIAQRSVQDLVYLDIPETLDLEQFRFPDQLLNIVDPTSTSQGEKINKSFRFVEGMAMDGDGHVTKTGETLCTITRENALGVDMSLRSHLLRTSFEGCLELEQPEAPFVCGERHGIEGQNLTVALMNLKAHTWEDAIAVSETAAANMAAIRYTQEVIETFGPLALKVKEGQEIRAFEHLADGVADDGKPHEFYSKKMLTEGWVDKITVTRTIKQEQTMMRWRFWLARRAPLQTGDKLTTRFGTKGVVVVVPDEQMPHLPNGEPVDCCIAPESVVARKAMGVFWEMMMNRKCATERSRLVLPHGEQLYLRDNPAVPSFEQLVEEDWGSKTQLTYKNKPLPERTFVAPLYIFRLDKIAVEQASVQKGEQAKNHHGIPVNSGKRGGQKRDLAKLIAMQSRGLHTIVDRSIEDNMAGMRHFEQIASVLEPEAFV
jgi:hypothetical protein